MRRNPKAGSVRRPRPIGRNIRYTFVNLAGETQETESGLERLFTLLKDREPRVKSYVSQPERLSYIDENFVKRTYVPDFMVLLKNGDIEIHEITVSSRRETDSARRREAAARRIYSERGWKYYVHTEESLPQRTEATNLFALHGFKPRAYRVADAATEIKSRLANATGPVYLRALVAEIAEQSNILLADAVSTALHMIWHREVESDLTTLILSDGEVEPDVIVGMGSPEADNQ